MPKPASRQGEQTSFAPRGSFGSLVNVQRVPRFEPVSFEGCLPFEGRPHAVSVQIALGAKRNRSQLSAADQITTILSGGVGVAVANRVVGLEAERFPSRVTRVVVGEEVDLFRFGRRRRRRRTGARRQAVALPRVPGGRVLGRGAIAQLLEQLGGLGDLVGADPA